MRATSATSAALARKDLLLELRSRDTVPAMLLFVVSALVVFHFALPADTAGDTAADGLLWIGIVFTALLGLTRAFVAEREEGVLDGLALATPDRSAIWLGKAISIVVFLAHRRGGGAARLLAVLRAGGLGARRGGRCSPTSASPSSARCSRRWRPRAGPASCSCRSSSCRSGSRSIVGGVGATVADDPGRYLAFLALYDLVFAILSWASFEYVVTE